MREKLRDFPEKKPVLLLKLRSKYPEDHFDETEIFERKHCFEVFLSFF